MSWTVPSTCTRTRSGSGAQTVNSTGADMRGPPETGQGGERGGAGIMPGGRTANPCPPRSGAAGRARPAPAPGRTLPARGSDHELLAHVDPVRVADPVAVQLVERLPAASGAL